MADVLVVNASPLIFLANANRLDLLGTPARPVRVPLAVAEEIRRYGPRDRASAALERTKWLSVVENAAAPASVCWSGIWGPESRP